MFNVLRWCAIYLLVVGGLSVGMASAQEEPAAATPAPPPTQSQSGYPDIRRQAADPSLFPDPDEAARTTVRRSTPGTGGGGGGRRAGGREARGAGSARAGNQALGAADADPLALRVAYRRAKTVAQARNPELGLLLRQADTAETDPEKRRLLRVYYTQLFAAVCRVDASPAMKSHVDSLRRVAEQRYDPKRRNMAGDEDLLRGGGRGGRGRRH